MKDLLKKPHIIFSVESGRYPAKRKVAHKVAMAALGRTGNGKVVELKGHYGAPETSILVVDPTDQQAALARKIAHETGQESHIESDGHSHKLYFNHGDQAGTIIHGAGTVFHSETPKDNYSVLPDGTIFSHNFNFEQSSPHPHSYDWHDGHSDHYGGNFKKAELTHPHLQAHGPSKGNDQAGGNTSGEFHNVMGHFGTITPGKKSNLKFYRGIDRFHDKIDDHIKQSGHQVYLAGGKHGRPDLANKNYNTKHLMIFDPTEGSGGDFGNEQFTSAWRKIHEKAHADTLGEINKKYGEGRRLGKLGVRTPREMKRAVEWEHLAAHKQRQLMEGLGHKISDEDFAKEYNTVIGDAVHRAITGQFTDPHEMGFEPHSKPVSLSSALSLIDAHAAKLGLRHDDDNLMKLRADKGIQKTEGDNNQLKIPKAPGIAKAPSAPEHPVDKALSEISAGEVPDHAHLRHISSAVDEATEKGIPLTPDHLHKVFSFDKGRGGTSFLGNTLLDHPAFNSSHVDTIINSALDSNQKPADRDDKISKIYRNGDLHRKMSSDQANRFFRWSHASLGNVYLPEAFFQNVGNKITKETLDQVVPKIARMRGAEYEHNHQHVIDLPTFDASHAAHYEEYNPNHLINSKFTTPEKLHHLIDTDYEALELPTVLKSPALNKDHLNKMVNKIAADDSLTLGHQSSMIGDMLRHEKFDSNALRAIWKEEHPTINEASGLRHSLYRDLAKAPNLPEDVMEDMLDKDGGTLGPIISRRDNLSPKFFNKGLNHPVANVRGHFLKNHEDATHAQLSAALKDPSVGVRLAAIEHNNITPEHIEQAMPNLSEGLAPEEGQSDVEFSEDKNLYEKSLKERAKEHGVYEDPDKVEFSLGTGKVRQLADMAEKAGGKIHKKDAEKAGLNPQALKVQHLQDSQGHIDAAKLRGHIAQQPKLKYGWSEREYGSANENNLTMEEAFDAHMGHFDPEDYGVRRSDYVDPEKSMNLHMENFKPEHYGVKREDHADEDSYERAVDRAMEDHVRNYDQFDWADDDNAIDQRAYERALENADREHNDSFDSSNYNVLGPGERDDEAEREQRHSNKNSKVFQLNITKDQAKKLKEAGVYDHFKELVYDSYSSGHPASKGNGIGWVRYTEGPDGMHIDEIQSDFGQSFSKQLKSQAKQAVANGSMSAEEADRHVRDAESKYPEDAHKKISEILFQGQHPNDILHEAFLQHLRDKGHVGKKVHIWQAESKAPLSNMDEAEELPVHMIRTYKDIPKKMGYKPSEYGELNTQTTDDLQGEPTWAQTLVKKEHRLNLLKAFVEMEKSKNVREQRRKVFGTDANAPRTSEKRMKMMNQIREYAKQKYGMDLNIASGKRDAEGNLREKPSRSHEPFDVYTKEGIAEEKARQKELKERGETRYDPKPDWRSGNLETQPSPDAAVHELAHLDLAPEGVTPEQWQTEMDAAYAQHGKEYGHGQGKRTSWEVQPMSIENPIRRELGLPANRASKEPLTSEQVQKLNQGRKKKGLPELQLDPETGVELTWDDKNPRFVSAKDAKGKPTQYDRQSRLSTPETKQRVQDIREGTLKFHPDKGWYRASDANALINLRAQGRAEEAGRRAIERFGKPQEEEKLAASEDMKKMSRAKLRFPNLPKMPTRPDADVRLLETGRQKDLYGRAAANQLLIDAIKDPRNEGKVVTEASRKKTASSVSGKFDRRTLGTSVPTDDPKGKTFDAALAGKLRSKFEGTSPGYKEGALEEYKQKVNDYRAKAVDLGNKFSVATDPAERESLRTELIRLRDNVPKKPRKLPVKVVQTKDLSPEAMALRGKTVESTVEHEAAHSLFRKLGAMYGKDFENKARKHILDSFPKEAVGAIRTFIEEAGYKPKSQYFEEELITHARDLLVNPTKREKFKNLIGDKAHDRIKEIKSGWQEAVKRAKGIKPNSFNE